MKTEIQGKIRIRKLNKNGEVVLDKDFDATYSITPYGSIVTHEEVFCDNNETLELFSFVANDSNEFKQVLIENDRIII